MECHKPDPFPTEWPYYIAQDFAKSNVSAKWAEGHPKQWGAEDKSTTAKSCIRDGVLSQDVRFLAIAGDSEVSIYSCANQNLCQVISPPEGNLQRVLLRGLGDGKISQYCLLVTFGSIPYPQTAMWKLDEYGQAVRGREPKSTTRGSLLRAACNVFSPLNDCYLIYARERAETEPKNKSYHSHTIEVWDIASEFMRNRIENAHDDMISWLDFSPDGLTFVTSSWDQTVKIWKAKSGALLRTFGPTGAQNWIVSHSPNSKRIACGTGKGIHVWDTDNGELVFKLNDSNNWVRSLAWHPNNQYLAYSHPKGGLRIQNPESGEVLQQWQLDLTRRSRYDSGVSVLGWLEQGRKISYTTGSDAGIEVYDMEQNIKWRFAPNEEDTKQLINGWRPQFPAFWIENDMTLLCLDADEKIRIWHL
jgi:WD40 repeat protein